MGDIACSCIRGSTVWRHSACPMLSCIPWSPFQMILYTNRLAAGHQERGALSRPAGLGSMALTKQAPRQHRVTASVLGKALARCLKACHHPPPHAQRAIPAGSPGTSPVRFPVICRQSPKWQRAGCAACDECDSLRPCGCQAWVTCGQGLQVPLLTHSCLNHVLVFFTKPQCQHCHDWGSCWRYVFAAKSNNAHVGVLMFLSWQCLSNKHTMQGWAPAGGSSPSPRRLLRWVVLAVGQGALLHAASSTAWRTPAAASISSALARQQHRSGVVPRRSCHIWNQLVQVARRAGLPGLQHCQQVVLLPVIAGLLLLRLLLQRAGTRLPCWLLRRCSLPRSSRGGPRPGLYFEPDAADGRGQRAAVRSPRTHCARLQRRRGAWRAIPRRGGCGGGARSAATGCAA